MCDCVLFLCVSYNSLKIIINNKKFKKTLTKALYCSVDLATTEVSPYLHLVIDVFAFATANERHFNSQFINKCMYGKIDIPLESIWAKLAYINHDHSMK